MSIARILILMCPIAALLSAAALLTFGVSPAMAQGTMRRPVPESETTDANGNLKQGVAPGRARISGTVVLSDGTAANELVDIYAVCPGSRILVATADSKGRFSVSLDTLSVEIGAAPCALQPHLEGYHAEAKPIPDAKPGSDAKAGQLVLQPLSTNVSGFTSAADKEASKSQQKTYEKALDQAARTDWPHALASLRQVTAAYPGFSSAWLTLGLLELSGDDRQGAHDAFLAAIRADPKFALPLIQAAALEASEGNWTAARDHSRKALDLNGDAFPNAWALNALGNLGLQNVDVAEQSARTGLHLDAGHEYPELEYALGSALAIKQQVLEAIQYLQAYVNRSPHGLNADAARSMLAELRSSTVTAPATAAAESTPAPPSSPVDRGADLSSPAGAGPVAAALYDRNAPLLAKIPDYACLETITRTKLDARGKASAADLFRVEVGISDDREIYGYAGGKRFSSESLAEMLGSSFSTTGVFSSLARALIGGSGTKIAFGGSEVLNGQPVYRYNFRSVSADVWSIRYGKFSGRAGEEGSFFVDKAQLTLLRVVARAVQVPATLKLKQLDAVIDYQAETLDGRSVLLPYAAQVHVNEASGIERVSRMFFDHCRSFRAESTVVFDGAKPQDEKTMAARNLELPSDLEITISLASPVSIATADVSDVVTAVVSGPVSGRGHELIAPGAAVVGHVRRSRGESAVIVELDRVETRGGWAPFYARLVSIESTEAKVDRGGASRNSSMPEVPGVAKIVFATESAELKPGTHLLWKTESLFAPDAVQPQLNTRMGVQ